MEIKIERECETHLTRSAEIFHIGINARGTNKRSCAVFYLLHMLYAIHVDLPATSIPRGLGNAVVHRTAGARNGRRDYEILVVLNLYFCLD